MNAILYIHGKGGSATESEHYKLLFPDCEVIGLDYQTFTPWETGQEIRIAVKELKRRFENIILIANSIGAFFSMNAGIDNKIQKAYFISPIVDMEKLITDMMKWANGKQLFREIQSRLPHRHAWLCTCQQVRPPYEFYLREGFKLYKSEEVGPGLTWAYLEKSIQAPRFTFNTVGLFTNNNKATVEFYTKTFGFTTSWDGVQPNVEMFLGNNRIILFPRSAFEQMVSKRFQYPEGFNGTMELSFDVPTFADVDKEYQNTLNCGAKSVLPPTTEPWGQRTCYVADPDGNLIEIGSFVKQ